MTVRPATDADRSDLVRLIAEFRVALAALGGRTAQPDAKAAAAELAEHEARRFPIFVAEADGAGVIGYLVCRVDAKVVWAESLFVLPDHRRRGIASALYDQAERIAAGAGGQTVFNWIHPNNDAVIAFLRKRGYDVLNLIEVRRPVSDEPASRTIKVGSHKFRH